MVRRKTNRKHMTSDHHGRVAERATPLVRAVDEILGTHNRKRDSIEAHLTIVLAAVAVSRWIEHATGWSIRKFAKTARRYRTIQSAAVMVWSPAWTHPPHPLTRLAT